MSRFQFRLQSLLELRRAGRDAARAAVADAQRALSMLDGEIASLQQQRSGDAGERQGSVTVDRLIHEDRYRMQLDMALAELTAKRSQIEAETQKRRDRLIQADRDVRQLERLREAKQQEHREEMLRREQRELDEIASLRHRRRPQGSARDIL